MSQSLKRLLAHLVFSTKNRRPYLKPDVLPRVHGYIAATIRKIGTEYVVVGGVGDHVHVLFELGVDVPPINFVAQTKRQSSKFIKTLGEPYRDFAWQRGYGLFSVSPPNRDIVANYVQNQSHHHRNLSFQDEFRTILKQQGVDWDERYLWD